MGGEGLDDETDSSDGRVMDAWFFVIGWFCFYDPSRNFCDFFETYPKQCEEDRGAMATEER